MKIFIYRVGAYSWTDNEAWGEAWRLAKQYATLLHTAIYRDVIKDNKLRQQVYYAGGGFNSIEFIREDNVKIW